MEEKEVKVEIYIEEVVKVEVKKNTGRRSGEEDKEGKKRETDG